MVYVVDRAIFGKKKAREWIKREVKKEFNVKEGSLIHDYLGITIIRTLKGYLLHQKDTIVRMEQLFGPSVKDLRSYATPMQPKESEPVMEAIEQSKY